ncbi:MAG: transposase family protein [Thiomargarita sp.]|nr:transposase family protein [Thiomargarita sp.]
MLTIYYLRHYPTFINLADVFKISESYCHQIYSRYVRILAEVETLPNRKKGLENPPDTLIIDVTEQPIERPVKCQKSYYSGKKKRHSRFKFFEKKLEPRIQLRFKYWLLPLEKFYRLTVQKVNSMIFLSSKKVGF